MRSSSEFLYRAYFSQKYKYYSNCVFFGMPLARTTERTIGRAMALLKTRLVFIIFDIKSVVARQSMYFKVTHTWPG